MTHKFQFRDLEVPYDHKAVHSWKTQRAITGVDGPAAAYDAYDRILCGRSAEVAEQLGDDADAMIELVSEILTIDPVGKN